VRGGLVVFDEYAVDEWGESDAVDEFFGSMGVRLRIPTNSPTPSAYAVKP
jgi:hypothetical protein